LDKILSRDFQHFAHYKLNWPKIIPAGFFFIPIASFMVIFTYLFLCSKNLPEKPRGAGLNPIKETGFLYHNVRQENMKTTLLGLILAIASLSCYAQQFETWVLQTNSMAKIKGNIVSYDDYGLNVTTQSKLSYYIPSKDNTIKWDDITELKVRNKTRHQTGMLIGIGVGFVSGLILAKNWPDKPGSFGIGKIFASAGMVGVGVLAGHLVTSAKIAIPINGKNATERKLCLDGIINPQE